jgi:hypothetical protein
VRKRLVFYIPGYDPMPPRKYRERYRREAAAQAAISGYDIALGPKQSTGRFAWHVTAQIEGAAVETEIDVLYWADIVSDSMMQGVGCTYVQLLRTAWAYIGSGALFRLFYLRKGPVIAALYPVVVLCVQLFAALLVWGLIAWAVGVVFDIVIARLAAYAIGAYVAWRILTWFKKRDHVLAWYLMHDYAFSAAGNGAYPDEQETRMSIFANRIAQALGTDIDEVLVVGHSSGAYIAVSILADLLRAGRVPKTAPALSLLTLGHVVPMISFLPNAKRLRGDLAYLSTRDEITWVDISAPGDGCSFALCDPVSVSGVAPKTGKKWPLVISAAFRQSLSQQAQDRIGWNLFEWHFQYLNAFDRPGVYDYFRITAGPMTLGARFAGHMPSKSRIERAVNRYTDCA